jgi:hypothetical protein
MSFMCTLFSLVRIRKDFSVNHPSSNRSKPSTLNLRVFGICFRKEVTTYWYEYFINPIKLWAKMSHGATTPPTRPGLGAGQSSLSMLWETRRRSTHYRRAKKVAATQHPERGQRRGSGASGSGDEEESRSAVQATRRETLSLRQFCILAQFFIIKKYSLVNGTILAYGVHNSANISECGPVP